MKSGLVVRGIARPEADALRQLGRYGVATVHEAQGRTGLMQPVLRPVWSGAHVCGSAVTVLAHPGDNWMLHVAAEEARPGDVIVVALSSECSDGFFGELLATSYRARGVTALVIDGGVRDVAALREMGFPVWARAVCAKGTVKATVDRKSVV